MVNLGYLNFHIHDFFNKNLLYESIIFFLTNNWNYQRSKTCLQMLFDLWNLDSAGKTRSNLTMTLFPFFSQNESSMVGNRYKCLDIVYFEFKFYDMTVEWLSSIFMFLSRSSSSEFWVPNVTILCDPISSTFTFILSSNYCLEIDWHNVLCAEKEVHKIKRLCQCRYDISSGPLRIS